MRLINTKTLKLSEFADGAVPPYSILSHVWGDQADECCLQDFARDEAHSEDVKSKPGYAKIVNFCRVSLENGFEWAWADTVCIDKSEYEELNTAINSMFAWYERSEVCYAYLEDTQTPEADNESESAGDSSESSWSSSSLVGLSVMEALKHAQWFTRGWTLPELIAPTTISFFSRDWTFICSRHDARAEIRRITSVPLTLLSSPGNNIFKQTKSLNAYTSHHKMQWMSKRHTRHEEDMAYCLLGLFDVQMPIRYGEGERAFERLQDLIIRIRGDASVLMWQADPQCQLGDPGPCRYLASHPSAFHQTSTYMSPSEVKEPVLIGPCSQDMVGLDAVSESQTSEPRVIFKSSEDVILFRPLIQLWTNDLLLWLPAHSTILGGFLSSTTTTR